MKAKELREMSEEDRMSLEEKIRGELFQLSNEKRINRSLEKPHLIREKRKAIARIKTFSNEKKAESRGKE